VQAKIQRTESADEKAREGKQEKKPDEEPRAGGRPKNAETSGNTE
jgi:hypothetical protein